MKENVMLYMNVKEDKVYMGTLFAEVEVTAYQDDTINTLFTFLRKSGIEFRLKVEGESTALEYNTGSCIALNISYFCWDADRRKHCVKLFGNTSAGLYILISEEHLLEFSNILYEMYFTI